jgi:hypothetical protein
MPGGFPPLFRATGRAAPLALALAILTLALAGSAAAGERLAAAQRELALWVDSLETNFPTGSMPSAAFPQAAVWLAAAGGEGGEDEEFARALCRPRYAALAGHGDALARHLAAADGAGAEAVYRGRILPTCLEIALCLRAASPGEEGR